MARILCLHGLGGTRHTMQPLVDELAAAGHTVHAPTLPGHGTRAEDLVGVSWADWMAAASEWPADAAVGQSLGGSLALALAAQGACRAVVAINPPPPDPDALEGLEWRRSRGHDWLDGPPLADGEVGYTTLPISALIEMADGVLATDLTLVTVPLLLVTSALDDTVDRDNIDGNADIISAAVRGPVTRLTLPNSGHVATLGPDVALLAAAISDFCANISN